MLRMSRNRDAFERFQAGSVGHNATNNIAYISTAITILVQVIERQVETFEVVRQQICELSRWNRLIFFVIMVTAVLPAKKHRAGHRAHLTLFFTQYEAHTSSPILPCMTCESCHPRSRSPLTGGFRSEQERFVLRCSL